MSERVLASRKYSAMDLPRETIEDLIRQEMAAGKHPGEVEKSMREKLHQIIAPYLGDPDYKLEEKRLAEEQARREAEEAERKRREEEELKKRPPKREKSPTEKLFELGIELSVHEERPAGSVTDQIRGLTLEEEIPASPGGVTDKLQKIDVPCPKCDNPVDPAFQRRRGAPAASVRSWNSSDVN